MTALSLALPDRLAQEIQVLEQSTRLRPLCQSVRAILNDSIDSDRQDRFERVAEALARHPRARRANRINHLLSRFFGAVSSDFEVAALMLRVWFSPTTLTLALRILFEISEPPRTTRVQRSILIDELRRICAEHPDDVRSNAFVQTNLALLFKLAVPDDGQENAPRRGLAVMIVNLLSDGELNAYFAQPPHEPTNAVGIGTFTSLVNGSDWMCRAADLLAERHPDVAKILRSSAEECSSAARLRRPKARGTRAA